MLIMCVDIPANFPVSVGFWVCGGRVEHSLSKDTEEDCSCISLSVLVDMDEALAWSFIPLA